MTADIHPDTLLSASVALLTVLFGAMLFVRPKRARTFLGIVFASVLASSGVWWIVLAEGRASAVKMAMFVLLGVVISVAAWLLERRQAGSGAGRDV